MSTVSARLVADLAGLEEIAPQWDALAQINKRPLQSPAWLLAWLRHLAPQGAIPRAVEVRAKGELVALAPFYIDSANSGRLDYRLMGDALPRSSPLVHPGFERDAAIAIGEVLNQTEPRPDVVALEGEPANSSWGRRLRDHWPSSIRPPTRRYLVQDSPTIGLKDDSFEAWLAGKSSNFRGQMRRTRRDFVEAGGSARISDLHTLEADIDAFMRLHSARWEGRGTSSIAARSAQMRATFGDVGRAQAESCRFRLWMLEIDGEPISAQLFVEAGGEVVYMNGGWDERFAKLKPAILGILYAIEDSFTRREERIDLGPGEQPYKLRFADGNDPIAWTILMVPGRRLPLTAARLAPMLTSEAARGFAKRALSARNADRVRKVRNAMTRGTR
jgi:CelD/BcsL family acetyltransferase involved in cellulose biosynthesis